MYRWDSYRMTTYGTENKHGTDFGRANSNFSNFNTFILTHRSYLKFRLCIFCWFQRNISDDISVFSVLSVFTSRCSKSCFKEVYVSSVKDDESGRYYTRRKSVN